MCCSPVGHKPGEKIDREYFSGWGYSRAGATGRKILPVYFLPSRSFSPAYAGSKRAVKCRREPVCSTMRNPRRSVLRWCTSRTTSTT